MASPLRIPTIFTAVDRISSVVRRISGNVTGFATRAESSLGRVNRLFRKLTPGIGSAAKQLLSFASAASVISGGVMLANFSKDKIIEYEDAVASFRTIVSDLNNADFAKFESAIATVATKSKSSTVEVAKSFEVIAGLNQKLAETPEGISKVTEAVITLSRASRDDLGTSAENLVGIMNQFSLGAESADRVINVLAAGQAVGAASISNAAESYKNFGSVAAGANITLEESVGLIQTLGKFNILGSEAGNKLKSSVIKLQKAGIGYQSGQFKINDALDQANKKMKSLRTEKAKDAFVTKVFGAENINAGRILLSNTELFREFTKGVTNTSEAQLAAKINSSTLSAELDKLKATWVNLITTSDTSNKSLERVKNVIRYVTDNMADLLVIIGKGIGVFIALRLILLALNITMGAYNVVLGISSALSATAAVAVGQNTIALAAYNVTTKIVTASLWLWSGVMKAVTVAQWLWNAAMLANPIGLITIAVVALIAAVVAIIYYWDEWGSTVAAFLPGIGSIISIFKGIYKHWDMIKKAFKTEGMIGGIKALGRVILDALLEPIQKLLEMISKIPGLKSLAGSGAQSIFEIRKTLDVMGDNTGSEESTPTLSSPLMKQQETVSEKISNNFSNLSIDIKDPGGHAQNIKSSGFSPVPIKVSKTNGNR